MGANQSANTNSTSPAQSSQQPSISSIPTVTRQQANIQWVQNVLLVWLDSNIDINTDDCRNTITQLRRVVNEINTFTDADRCVQFIEATNDNKVCMIISGALSQRIVPRVHGMSQMDSIFIFCGNKHNHQEWVRKWTKIKGVFTQVDPICEALKHASRQCEQDAMPISLVLVNGDPLKRNLNQLDPSFMYTEILKKILFTIEFEPKHFKLFIEYCRVKFAGNNKQLENIKKLERTYQEKSPIWWYTCECFLYPMLNLGLRTMDCDIIIKMGFFINDLHRQIQQLHSEQFGSIRSKIFKVYRGQGLSTSNFEQMKNTQGGLISFNNFLSTSKVPDVSMTFARSALSNSDSVGVVFVMTIDPTQSTTPFASVTSVSYFGEDEDEVLFSMHSVFRIVGVQSMDGNARLFQVNLTLTNDNDKDLRQLTERIEAQTSPGQKGWYRLGSLLLDMGQPKKAEEVFLILVEQCDDDTERGDIYHCIGGAKHNQGEYLEAIKFYEEAVRIKRTTLPSDQLSLAASYNNVGMAYKNMSDYPKALSSLQKALAIKQELLSPDHLDLASSYNNIGLVHGHMGDYHQSLASHEKALAIRQRSLLPNHPDVASSYGNIGNVHKDMGNYSKALASLEKAHVINQRVLPSNHPDLAMSYGHIGDLYLSMKEYSKARPFCEKAVGIAEQSLSPNPEHLKWYRNNLDSLMKKCHQLSDASSQ